MKNDRVKNWTKGPWAYKECVGQCYFEVVQEADCYRGIADFCASQHKDDGGLHRFGGEAEANATLVSAAPDMVEALERLTDWLLPEIEHGGHDEQRLLSDLYDKAEAALSKAYGEQ